VSQYTIDPTTGALTLRPATVPTGQDPAGIAVIPLVVPGPRLPTSKNQCSKGRWQSFGTLCKNQGDCMSFVAAGGKNPPSGGVARGRNGR
jgi:hypothetical protein